MPEGGAQADPKARRLLLLLDRLVTAETGGRSKRDLLQALYDHADDAGDADLAARREQAAARKLSRDLGELRRMGLPITVPGEPHRPDAEYRFERSRWEMPSLDLDEGEATAILRLAHVTDDGVIGVAMAKLVAAMSRDRDPSHLPRLARETGTEHDGELRRAISVEPVPTTTSGGPADPDGEFEDRIDRLTSAIAARKRISFTYESRRGSSGQRTVEPYVIAPRGRGWYLIGRDVDKGEQRVFRLDRIGDVTGAWKHRAVSADDFTVPDDLDVADALDFAAIAPVDAAFAVHPDFDAVPLPWESREVGQTPDGWLRYEVDGCSERVLIAFALRSTPNVEVLEPDDLRRRVADSLRDVATVHGPAGS